MPPAAFAVMVLVHAVSHAKLVVEMLTVSGGGGVTIMLEVAVHPFASVTVTV